MIEVTWRRWILAALLGSVLSMRAAQAECPFSMAAAASVGGPENGAPAEVTVPPGSMADMLSCPPHWTVTADLLILQRAPRGGPDLLTLSNNAGLQALMSASDLNYHVGTGPRLSVVRHGSEGWGLETNYFQVSDYRASAYFNNLPVEADLHVDINGGPAVDSAHFSAASQLRSAEVNFRRDVSDWLTPMIGFRWTELAESYAASGEIAGFLTPYEHTIDTTNRLYGVQLGAQGVLWRRDNLRLESVLKAGLYANGADQNTVFDNPTPFGRATASDKRTHPAFLGELGFTIAYQFTEHLSIRGGYQFLWIEGVALPPQQIEYTTLTSLPTAAVLNCSSGLYYQGGTIGLDFQW